MTETETPRAALDRVGAARLAVGLIQGLALYALGQTEQGKAWPASEPALYAALVLVFVLVPPILLAGLGALRTVTLALWSVAAAVIVAGLAAHDLLRADDRGLISHPASILASAAILFIAHHLIAAGDAEGKVVAFYPRYFDIAWKHGVQLVLALAFVGVFWIVLLLGAALFKLIGLDFLGRLMEQNWFRIPVSTVVFAAAVHLTDVRAGLTKGARTLGLTLLSWLLPVMTFIVVGFLLALPFTGLTPLWRTGHAAGLMLGAAALLVILINAAYQGGEEETSAAAPLRWAARIAGVALVPLVAVAGYGLWLRVGQYGLSPDRVVAAGCLVVAGAYALGYAVAAVLPGAWMKWVETANIATAILALAILAALFSPIADPARIAVADQVRRLESGAVAPDRFDFAFLRFDGAKWGERELERLSRSAGTPRDADIARRAAAALKLENRWEARPAAPPAPAPAVIASRITVRTPGRVLPPAFVGKAWDKGWPNPACLRGEAVCDAWFLDLDGDAREEIFLNDGSMAAVYGIGGDGAWRLVGAIADLGCPGMRDALKAGAPKAVPSRWQDIEVGGRRLALQARDEACPA